MIALALALAAHTSVADLRVRVEAQPRRVREFVERRAMCNHWLGEEPYDAARRREIERAIRSLRCGVLDSDEASLRSRYARKPATLAILDETADSLGW